MEHHQMNVTSNDIEVFRNKILDWYSVNKRNFYWRNKSLSNYQKLVVEVLLQRTKAETIAKFFPIFLEDYPSWKSIAMENIKDLEESLKPIGLYKQRALRLRALAQKMVERGGRIPRDYEKLSAMPMVGQYIANAAMSVIHDEPYPMLDVNMARVLERYFGQRKLADIRYDPYLKELSTRVVDTPNSKTINWALLDFGAVQCTASQPNCNKCPVNVKCLFFNYL